MLFLRRSGKALDPSNSTEIPELLKFQLFKVSYRARLSRLVQFTTSHVGQTPRSVCLAPLGSNLRSGGCRIMSFVEEFL